MWIIRNYDDGWKYWNGSEFVVKIKEAKTYDDKASAMKEVKNTGKRCVVADEAK
jgi:hypothetical protein